MSNFKCQISNDSQQNLFTIIRQRWISLKLRNLKFETVNFHNGFTLIELLVTIAIIGILSSVLLVNLSGFRERTRDVQRKRDLRTLQTALELYRADLSSYPSSPLPTCGADFKNPDNQIIYLKKTPCDPLTKESYGYLVDSNTYTLFACLENETDAEKDTSKRTECSKASFTVVSP